MTADSNHSTCKRGQNIVLKPCSVIIRKVLYFRKWGRIFWRREKIEQTKEIFFFKILFSQYQRIFFLVHYDKCMASVHYYYSEIYKSCNFGYNSNEKSKPWRRESKLLSKVLYLSSNGVEWNLRNNKVTRNWQVLYKL